MESSTPLESSTVKQVIHTDRMLPISQLQEEAITWFVKSNHNQDLATSAERCQWLASIGSLAIKDYITKCTEMYRCRWSSDA
jgi:hypothetical protein